MFDLVGKYMYFFHYESNWKSSGWSFIVRWDLKGNIMSLAFLRCWQALLCSVMLEITSTHRFLLCGFQKLHYSCLPLLNWGQIYVIVIRWAGSGQQTFFFRLSHGGPSDNWYLKTILDVGFSHIGKILLHFYCRGLYAWPLCSSQVFCFTLSSINDGPTFMISLFWPEFSFRW